jgi:endonuclease/exonuclease/phosphatase family metal-dependent hydrolase
MKRWLALAAVVAAARCACRHEPTPEPVRIATFNIEDFPRDARQVAGAFAEIAATGASIVALQEIGDAELMERNANDRLGTAWRFVHASTGAGHHDIGLLYDAHVWTFVDSTIHDETRLGGDHKPTLEVRLARGGEQLHVFVVHLKAGGDSHAVRERQLTALAPVLRATRGPIVVLGDFNATGDPDRADLAELARTAGLVWATEPLACTAFWSRDDGCPRSRLDHVLSSHAPEHVEARGACATAGCDWQPSCPLYAHEISDHCPVVATYP